MSKSTVLPVRPTAAQVRASVKANPKAVAGLSEKAKANLDSRGRLGAEVMDAYNKGKRPEKRYVVGNTKAAKAEREATRATLRAQGLAGQRGPLSKAAKEALAQPKG